MTRPLNHLSPLVTLNLILLLLLCVAGSLQAPPKKKKKKYVCVPQRNFRCFCGKDYLKIGRHLEDKHKDEDEVKAHKAFPGKRCKERLDIFEKLRAKGNAMHNLSSLKDGETKGLVTNCRKVAAYSAEEIKECEYCHAFYSKSNIYRHRAKCASKSVNVKNSHTQGSTLAVLQEAVKDDFNSDFITQIVGNMTQDEVSKRVAKDRLIKLYGSRVHAKNRHFQHTYNTTSNKARELGRLVLSARTIDPNVQYLEDLLKIEKWETVIAAAAVLNVAGFEADGNTFKVPSLAAKIGYGLGRLLEYEEIYCITKNLDQRLLEIASLRKLLEVDWAERVSQKAMEN